MLKGNRIRLKLIPCYEQAKIAWFHHKNCGFHAKIDMLIDRDLRKIYNMLTNCRAKINPMTQAIAVKVRFSLLMARVQEKSWIDGLG